MSVAGIKIVKFSHRKAKTPTYSVSLELVLDLNVCVEATKHAEAKARGGRREGEYLRGTTHTQTLWENEQTDFFSLKALFFNVSARELAHQTKVIAVKPGSLGLITEIHMAEGEN